MCEKGGKYKQEYKKNTKEIHEMIKEIQPKGEKHKTNMWNEKKDIYKGKDEHNTECMK
jgi:hypothetical protein